MTMHLEINNQELEAQLEKVAKKKGLHPDALVTEMLEQSLQFQELYENEKIEDEKRWQSYKQGGNTISHKDMKLRFAELKQKAIKRTAEIG